MQLKSYQAGSIRDAMRRMRDELGDDAVIVSTTEDGDGAVHLTAALEPRETEPAPPTEDQATETGDLRGRLEAVFAYHRVTADLAWRLIERAADSGCEDVGIALATALEAGFRFAPVPSRDLARPLMLVGPAGAGKTVTTAKLATRLVLQGIPALVVNADGARVAAAAQLDVITSIIGARLAIATTPETLARTLAERDGGYAVLVDSAAVDPFARDDMARLRDLAAAIDAEPVVVLGAGLDAAEAADIGEAFVDLGARRMITTRVDQARRLGSVLTAAHAGGLAIADAGVTPHVAHGLTALDSISLARLLCRDPNDSTTVPRKVSE
jgi:flagellar biosynthesis protein FlhF